MQRKQIMVESKTQILFVKLIPLDCISEYQRTVVCMVSTVNLNSTILFNEDLIEDICFSTGLAATCCTFGIFVNILCHSIQNEGLGTFITLIIRTFNC